MPGEISSSHVDDRRSARQSACMTSSFVGILPFYLKAQREISISKSVTEVN